MEPLRIVVWDNIGNVLLGVRPWEDWSPRVRERLLAEDPVAREHAPSFADLFREYPLEVAWLYDPNRQPRGFSDLFGKNEALLCDATAPGAVERAVAAADFVVLHKETLPAEALHGARRLRLIQHLGLDYRGVPLAAARQRGIPVAATPLTNYLGVAEHTWALVLNHLKRLPLTRAQMVSREYADSWGYVPGQRLARGLTLGLLGLGEIARPLARYAQAFEMRAIYWDIARFSEVEARYGVEYVAWDEIFRQADILSVHLALNARTQGIVGAREIGLMKPEALFINTARGKLVDQAALVAALQARRIGGAALEVFAEEPLPTDDPLHALHEDLTYNVTLTPHSSSLAPWTWVHDSLAIWRNMLHVLRGEPIEYLV
ncbi:MAG: NAD(P)-dependent oxidoreductase [Thermomicrobiales bacterium]